MFLAFSSADLQATLRKPLLHICLTPLTPQQRLSVLPSGCLTCDSCFGVHCECLSFDTVGIFTCHRINLELKLFSVFTSGKEKDEVIEMAVPMRLWAAANQCG